MTVGCSFESKDVREGLWLVYGLRKRLFGGPLMYVGLCSELANKLTITSLLLLLVLPSVNCSPYIVHTSRSFTSTNQIASRRHALEAETVILRRHKKMNMFPRSYQFSRPVFDFFLNTYVQVSRSTEAKGGQGWNTLSQYVRVRMSIQQNALMSLPQANNKAIQVRVNEESWYLFCKRQSCR